VELLVAGLDELLVPVAHGALDLHRRADRAHGGVGLGDRRAEERHHAVAHELVEGALVAEEDVYGHAEVGVEEAQHLGRAEALAHGREAADVGEQDGDVPRLTGLGELELTGDDLFYEVW